MNFFRKKALASAIISGTAVLLAACSAPQLNTSSGDYTYNKKSKEASPATKQKNIAYFEQLQSSIVSQAGYEDPALDSAGSLLCEYPYNIPTTQEPGANDCTFEPESITDPTYWPRENYEFLDSINHPFESTSSTYDEYTINPSLLRMAKLNNKAGIDDVIGNAISAGITQLDDMGGKIYQVRGLDLAVMSFIWSPGTTDGAAGWIVVDPLTSEETARQAYELFKNSDGIENQDAPIRGIIFTHSHIDHFGGVAGLAPENCSDLVKYFAGEFDCGSGEIDPVEIIAPDEFFEHSVSENVMAGNIMSRRAGYMYGNIIVESGTKGSVDGGLGKITSAGAPGLIPAKEIDSDGHIRINGLLIDITMANGSEAPSEFMFYINEYKTLMAAEVITNTIHNISSMRGARTRDANAWVKYVDNILGDHGEQSELMIASHHWPTYGNDEVIKQLEKSRDMYKYVHDQALRLANKGYTPNEISSTVTLPASLDEEWYNHGYYGTVSHNARATYDFYLGAWWDGNPANLNPLTPAEEGVRFVAAMGDIDNVITTGIAAVNSGQYQWAVRLLNHAVFGYNAGNIAEYNEFADENELPTLASYVKIKYEKVRLIAADAMEQMGYQAESGPWRNYYLGAAEELRTAIGDFPTLDAVDTTGISSNMPISMGLESLALFVNPDEYDTDYLVTFTVSEEDEWFGTYYLNLSNSTLKAYQNPGNTELNAGNGVAEEDTTYSVPGNTSGYTQVNVTVDSEADMKQWIGEMFVNGGCYDSNLCIIYPDLRPFSAVFEAYPSEFGIATP